MQARLGRLVAEQVLGDDDDGGVLFPQLPNKITQKMEMEIACRAI